MQITRHSAQRLCSLTRLHSSRNGSCSLVPRPSRAPARKEGLAALDVAVRNVGWPITAQHSSIVRSLAVITRSTCRMLVTYLPKTSIDAAIGEAVPILQYTAGRLRSKPALSEFVARRDVLVVLPTGCGKSLCSDTSTSIGRTDWLSLHRCCQQSCSLPAPVSDGGPACK